ncbi:MAG: signal peptidase I [Eubacterium sp.]|nr:signal peptidase I [Eubacterium sp.]
MSKKKKNSPQSVQTPENVGARTEGEEKKKEPSMGRELLGDIIMIIIVVIGVFLLEKYVLLNAKIPSESMQNTIMVGNRIFGNRLAYRDEGPDRYDIIIFKYPDDESQYFIKRVIGLPGDEIDIHDGNVYVNGSETPLTDSFCPLQGVTDEGDLDYPLIVPDDCYFMLGDNREHSKDSRYWDQPFVRSDQILAKAVLRYWPLGKLGMLKHGQEDYYQPPAAGA